MTPRYRLMGAIALAAVILIVLLVIILPRNTGQSPVSHTTPTAGPQAAFSTYADDAIPNLVQQFYQDGKWKVCVSGCGTTNQDWGADSLTYTLFLRWKLFPQDTSIAPLMGALADTAPLYSPPCGRVAGCDSWSDVPEWDSIALGREMEVTGGNNALMLEKEKAAFAKVDLSDPSVYAFGACPDIHYQQPGGGANKLKTLETDANYIKAALLLYRYTHDQTYLDKAKAEYASVRRVFLDSKLTLYSVYVFDDGTACRQVPGRFYASVNGDMIYNGLWLANETKDASYHDQAIATAKAVTTSLGDATGVYVNMQAENDIEEPLIEAMYDVAIDPAQTFARDWLRRNAVTALPNRKADGTYSRNFTGPASAGTSTAWQVNGGYALALAAGALFPHENFSLASSWTTAKTTVTSITTDILPAAISFSGRGIALIGTIGAQCCEPGHARIFIDGKETTDTSGIWQNKSSSGKTLSNSVLFAWQWPTAGLHAIQIQPGEPNGKEGGSFIAVTSYMTIP